MSKENYETEDLISVIIPIYKVEKYIDECIESIVRQTYSNLEIILVDDGSPDRCPQNCDEWSTRDNRIKVIHKKNEGLSCARNTGIEHSNGKYIVFIDGDDVININMIKTLYENMRKMNADMSVCELKTFKDKDTIDINEKVATNNLSLYNDKDKFDNLFNSKIGKSVVSWNKLYKKEIFKDIRFPKGKFHEDVFTAHHIIDKAKRIVFTDAILYFYRKRELSTTSAFDLKRLEEIEGMKDRMNFFDNKYAKTKYVNLSIIAYSDKLIRTYCLLKYNDSENMHTQILKNIKIEYNKVYKRLKGVPEKFSRRIKHAFFYFFPRLFYIIIINKYSKEERILHIL